MSIRYVINPLLAIGILAVVGHYAGGIVLFLDGVSILISIGVPVVLLLGSFGIGEIISFLGMVIGNNADDPKAIARGIVFYDAMQASLIASAVLGIIIGAVQILATADDISGIGPGLAVGLLTVFYSSFVILVFVIPFRAGLRKMIIEPER